jgi:ketol-acid reductoisomerase
MAKIDFGGVVEEVITSEEFSLDKAREVLKDETIVVLGYGVQGPAQALNLKDNGFPVIIGQLEGDEYWNKAISDGFVPGETLFPLEEAARKGTIAPKGSGTNVRRNFLDGSGINSSFAVFQDFTGRAKERTLALGIAIGSGYLFPTTFEQEVYSDLTGERGVLMGCLAGTMDAQYNILRKNGHSPSEAFNETVEELTQSLIRLVGENGMDWMFANCSTTAQRGALDWAPKFRDAVAPVFEELYDRVKTGKETQRVLEANSAPDYMTKLRKELDVIKNSEMWKAGAAVRSLRPENRKKE